MLPPTTLIPRDELSRLLDTMTPIGDQRITAEIAAVAPIEDVEIAAVAPVRSRSRFVVVVISFAVTLVLGIVIMLA